MKRLLTLSTLLLLSIMNFAQTEVDGIYYDFAGTEATVVSGANKYTGDVIIPASVTNGNQNYSVTRIYQKAFEDCSGLTSITIPNSVTSIGDRAFSHCYGLTSVTIGNSVTSIGNYAFLSCSRLTSITIPNSVTKISHYAFDGCSKLTSITIPNSVTSIGSYAFYGCSGLASVTIPNSVTSIGSSAFSGCKGLTSITIPNSVTSIGSSAFNGCSGLTSIKVQDGNTKYDSRNNCNAIIETASNILIVGCKNTTIPNSVTSIRDYAFSSCSGLTSITIPNSVTSIGEWAFSRCSGLTSITIPNSVTSIGSCAFNGCSGMTSVTIPNSVTNIGRSAFNGCSGLTSVTIPNSVARIEENTFYGCSGLTSITIPNSVTSIGSCAFDGCSGLTSVTIPNSVTSIDSYAFHSCSGLTSVTIPNSVTSIGSAAFYNCLGLTSVTIPNSVTSIREEAFYGCLGLTSVTWNAKKCTVSSYNYAPFYGIKTQITEFNFGDEVETIPDYLCYGMTDLTSIEIPNSVTSIGDYAFYGCSSLTLVESRIGKVFGIDDNTFSSETYNAELRVPQGLSSIYKQATGWKKFKSITEEEGQICGDNLTYTYSEASGKLTIQGTGAMYDYSSSSPAPWNSYKGDIITIVIEDGATSVGSYAFSDCSKLTSVTIPNSVKSIGKAAFSGCSGLTSVTIPNSVTSIGNFAFLLCSGLTSIEIPNSVTSIGIQAFQGCSGLTSIEIPNSVTSIGTNTFLGCSGLTSVTIPNSVTSIGKQAFYDCSGLTSITIPNSVTSIGVDAFSECSGLTSITIPNSVTSIGESAFEGCSGLTSIKVQEGNTKYDSRDNCNAIIETATNTLVIGCKNTTIPNSVTSIGIRAFAGCSGLTSITIPNSVTSIEYSAFSGCSGLTSIYSYIENPSSNTGSNFDSSNYSNATLNVPLGTKDKYLATDGWKNFANIVEMAPTPEPSTDNTLAISDADAYVGKQVVLPIDMNNVASIQAFQFDLYLPDGVTIAKDGDNEYMVELTSRAAKSHSISAQTRPDGAIRMVCTSMSGATFKGNEGTIVNVTLDVAPSMADGDYDIEVKNIELSDGTPYNPADIKATLTVKAYTPGDVDGTGTVSVNDAVCIINYILGSPIEGFIEAAADLDGNGVITVNDVVILINDYILGGNSQNSLDLAFLEDVTANDDYLFINDITMKAGETTEVEVYMNTSRTDIQGLQCDIYLPEGMEFVPEEDGDEKYYADKGGRAAKSHSVAAQLREDGSVRVVETSTSGAKFKDNDQAVFYFTVKAKGNMVAGNYEIKLANMELSYGGTPINPSDRIAKVVITDPSAINGVNAEDANSFVGKFIKDNKIIIMKNGKKHSVSGQGM